MVRETYDRYLAEPASDPFLMKLRSDAQEERYRRVKMVRDPFTGTVFVFRARKADRLKLLYWDGTGLVMAYKRLEEHSFTWPAVKDGLILMNHAQFEALFAGLDWRRVRAIEAKAPEAVE